MLFAIVFFSLPVAPRAGGLFLAAHGVRPLGRGGAFTAGGDDPGGIWYNPANIGQLRGIQVLLDASLIFLTMDYQRVDSGGNVYAPVSNEGPLIPIPTLGLTYQVLKERLTLGLSLSAPYAPLPGYPRPDYGPCDPAAPSRCIDTAAADSPQRYSLISLDGSLFLQLDLALAWRIIPQLIVGVSLQNLFVSFVSLQSISSYNGFSSGPEDPEFDSLSQMKLDDMFNPSAKIGVIVRPREDLSIGLALQLPFWVGGEAEVNVQLPASPLYTKSWVEGSSAHVALTLPLSLHAGVELRMIPRLRLELGFDWERWSVLDAIRVQPREIYIYNIPGIDRYKVPEMGITFNFRDTFAGRLGGECFLPWLPLTLRAGYVFERGSVEDAYASVLAMDSDKHMLAVGLGYTISGYRLDLVWAHFFFISRTVDFRESRSEQINPINPTGAVAVGGGSYSGFIDVLGLGLSKAF